MLTPHSSAHSRLPGHKRLALSDSLMQRSPGQLCYPEHRHSLILSGYSQREHHKAQHYAMRPTALSLLLVTPLQPCTFVRLTFAAPRGTPRGTSHMCPVGICTDSIA